MILHFNLQTYYFNTPHFTNAEQPSNVYGISSGMYQIARILKAEGIPRPTYHRRMAKGIKVEADDLCVWSASVVRDILQHREYIGDTVNFRTEITSA